ncbi:hypothetical protein [Actinoplanes sp. NPDC051851]|uniref:hypothetical protein n=1 Tax=Actinoplanes sp. NPDC051851 TaxID=3154753 RepID=UPI0034312FD3
MAGQCVSGDAVYIGDIGQISGFLSGGIDGILSKIAAAIMGAAVDLFADLGNVPTLAGSDTGSDTTAKSIDASIHLQTNWLTVTIAVASLLAAAFRMALERKGGPGVEALKGMVRMILVAGASWAVLSWVAAEADKYSSHLYDQGIKSQLKLIAKCSTDGLTAFLLIIVGLLLLIAGVVHVILMYIRLGLMTLLIGTLPMAAAASMTETGTGWWRKHIAWMVAWLAYKPTVGLIMYGGAAMIGATGGDAKQYKLAGAGILLLTGVALPALMRLVVPAMASFGAKDNMGGGIAAAGAGAGAVASGAKAVQGATNWAAGKGKSPSGSSTPSGSGSTPGGSGPGGAPGKPGSAARALGAAGRVLGPVAAAGVAAANVGQRAASGAASLNKHAQGISEGAIGD